MKNTKNIRSMHRSTVVLVSLMLVLALLTAATIAMLLSGASLKSSIPFDLEEITAENTALSSDASDFLIPEFIGITENGSGCASAVSAVITAELYRTLLPALSEVLAVNGTPDSSDNLWNSFIDRDCSVYIRFHQEITNYLICSLNRTELSGTVSPVYEVILLPYNESSDSATAAVRCYDGTVIVYTKKSPENIVTDDELAKLLNSYTSALTSFEFTESGEPVFTESLSSRDIIMTNGTAAMIYNETDKIGALLRIFELNPDKLLNTHVSEDRTGSYIAQKGIFRIEKSSFTYTAVQDGGVKVENYVGSQSKPTFNDCILAAYAVFERIGELNRHFIGGDADIILSSVISDGNRITVFFEYVFDNLRIIDISPAVTATFENGRLTGYTLYTLSARSLSTRTQSLSKMWFAGYLGKLSPENIRRISLVYRGDFISESVKAEWCGEEYMRKEN